MKLRLLLLLVFIKARRRSIEQLGPRRIEDVLRAMLCQ